MFYAQNIYNPIGESFPLLKKKTQKMVAFIGACDSLWPYGL